MSDFYVDTLRQLLKRGTLRQDQRVLVVCGGAVDRSALLASCLEHVVISNLDSRMTGDEFAPYAWSFQDAERLDYPNNAFDVCLVHSGLHHCRSPHRALLEMYRVAKQAVIVFEPLDSLAARVGVRWGLGEDVELAAVAAHEGRFGGLRNGPIPNYIYRWTEREIEKTINSHAPVGRHQFLYFYRMRLNFERAQLQKGPWLRWLFTVAQPVASLVGRLVPRLCNNFAFCVRKPDLPADIHPWLTHGPAGIGLNGAWMARRFQGDHWKSLEQQPVTW